MRTLVSLAFVLALPLAAAADRRELRVGVIASLSGFAAPYGSAVVEGAALARERLAARGLAVKLIVEDDQSQLRGAAGAYQKLRHADRIEALIGGSWWANGIVKTVERDGIPFLSCETLFNKDFVRAPNYFSLAGDLRTWIHAFVPLINQRQWKSALMVKFVSGFADTLEAELRAVFSSSPRIYHKPIEYSDLEMSGAAAIAAKIAALRPDMVFIDAQPQSFAQLIKELQKLKARNIEVLSHSVVEDALKQKLFDPNSFDGEIFFLRRSTYNQEFTRQFKDFYRRDPNLNADLGYYALLLVAQALTSGNPLEALRAGAEVDGIAFTFDENNVSHNVQQEVWKGQTPILRLMK